MRKLPPRLIDLLRPNYFICTNLFRDSMKRNGHIEYIRDIIKSGVRDDMKLILNGDDIVSSAIGDGKDAVYFGISRLRTDYSEPHNLVSDVVYCPRNVTQGSNTTTCAITILDISTVRTAASRPLIQIISERSTRKTCRSR